MQSIPHTDHPPDPALVLAYAAQHGSAAAARRYGVHDRTIRKWRQKHRPGPEAPARPTRTAQDAPQAARAQQPRGRVYAAPAQPAARFGTVAPDAVPHGHELWKCPMCGELMPPLPGQTGAEWAARGCYLCAVQPADPVDQNEAAPAPTPAHANTAAQADETPGPARPVMVQGDADPARPTAPAPVIIRQVIRVPVARRGGVIGWASERELIGPGPLLALVIFILLLLIL